MEMQLRESYGYKSENPSTSKPNQHLKATMTETCRSGFAVLFIPWHMPHNLVSATCMQQQQLQMTFLSTTITLNDVR